jgi:hypothetical protein
MKRATPGVLLLALPLLMIPRDRVSAQVEALVDLGIRDAPVVGVGTRSHWAIAPSLHYEGARLRLGAEGEYRDFGRLGHGLSGSLDGSWFLPLAGALRGEVTSALRGTGGGPTSSASLWNGGARLHLSSAASGLWLGGQTGGGTKGPSLQWDAALWWRFGNLTFQLQGSQLTLVDRVLRAGVAPDTLTPRPDTLYRDQARISTDVAAWLRWTPPRSELSLALGRRYGLTEVAGTIGGAPGDGTGLGQQPSSRTSASTWWMLEATYWLAARWGVSGSVGKRPPDTQLRTPGGGFLQFAIRTSIGRGPRAAGPGAPSGQRELRARRVDAGTVELLLSAGQRTRVEIRGDFTDWRPVEMERRSGGQWRLRQTIASGVHTLSVRYDGGPWVPPPGTRVVADEFGERTGVLVID